MFYRAAMTHLILAVVVCEVLYVICQVAGLERSQLVLLNSAELSTNLERPQIQTHIGTHEWKKLE